MSDRGFQQFLIVFAVVLLALGVGYVWPPGLAALGVIGLVVAICMDPEEG